VRERAVEEAVRLKGLLEAHQLLGLQVLGLNEHRHFQLDYLFSQQIDCLITLVGFYFSLGRLARQNLHRYSLYWLRGTHHALSLSLPIEIVR